MKYPAIVSPGERSGIKVLVYGQFNGANAIHLEGIHKGVRANYCVDGTKHITREYLANTKIRILSPEHSEFVQKLVFSAGYEWNGGGCLASKTDAQFLYIYDDGTVTRGQDGWHFIDHEHKEITIPMQPTENKEEDMKNNGDNLMFAGKSLKESRMPCEQLRKDIGCDDLLLSDKCEQWPFVLDKALCSFSKQECEVISTCGDFAWVSFDGRDAPETRHISQISKPKTPGGDFREWMIGRIGSGIASGRDCEAIANDLINHLDVMLHHLNITKKPQ